MNNTIRTSVVIAAFVSLAVTAAKADESTTTTTTTYGDSSGEATSVTTTKTTTDEPASTVIATEPAGSSVVYFRTASPDVLVTTLGTRRKNLETMIEESIKTGAFPEEKAVIYRRELKRIGDVSTPGISYSTAVMAAQDLDLIGDQYRTIVKTAPATYEPIINGTKFTISTGQVLQLDDLSVRRAELEGRVAKDLLQGRLSDSQAAELRAKLASLGNEQAIYNANGGVNDKEARHLYNEFDRVATQIEKIAGKDNTKENN
jgi:hypothetical protein